MKLAIIYLTIFGFFNLTFLIFLFVVIIFLLKFSRKKSLLFILIVIYFFGNGLVINRLLSTWEISGKNFDEIGKFKCGIILSGTFKYDRKLNRLIASHDADRIWQTIQLYKKGKIVKIILSGSPDKIKKSKNREFDYLKNILNSYGILANDIIEENLSSNTCENAKNCKIILEKNNYYQDKHLLITSSIHMKRSLSCFRKQGINVTPFATDQVNASAKGFKLNWIIPNSENLILWDKYFHEVLGYLFYKTTGCN